MTEKSASKVTGIDGTPVDDGKPNTFVVEILEEVLESAKSGAICDICVVAIMSDESGHKGWVHANRTSGGMLLQMLGGLDLMKMRIRREAAES